jgi:hypothetical protein
LALDGKNAFHQPYRPKTHEDIMAGVLSMFCSSLVDSSTKAGDDTYSSRARVVLDNLYSERGASFKDWDEVLKGRVGWEALLWGTIFYLGTEKVRMRRLGSANA